MRYRRDEFVQWLDDEGCEFDAVLGSGSGMIFYDRAGTQFVIPDPTNDGWLDVDLVEDVLANRWVGVGRSRPPRYES